MLDAVQLELEGAGIGAGELAHPWFVSAKTTQSALDWPAVIACVREAYSVPHGPAASPPRTVARGEGTWLRSLTAAPPASSTMGAKIFGMGRNRHVNYLVALFSQECGHLVGLVDANLVTAFRTAATSAVAVDRLAPRGEAVLGLLGSGLEAQSHARAIAAVRPLREVRVFSPTPERRHAFAQAFEAETGVACRPVGSAQEAITGATIAVAAARSFDETPILLGQWLTEGMMVVSIGSTLPEQREIDSEVVRRADLIVCDAVEEVEEETGDMLAAKADGVAFQHKIISLNALLCGMADERAAAARLPMFKSVGAAIQDIAVAELALKKAVATGGAVRLPIGFLTKSM